jgi:exosortase
VTLTKALSSDRLTGWHVAAGLVMAALGLAVTADAWQDILRFALNDDEYSHILLVPVVALWMVWVRRMRFRHCRPSGTVIGPLLAGLGWLISWYGYHHGHQSLWHGGSVLIVLGCVLSVLGKNVLFRFFPAIAVLAFLVPVPGMIRQHIALPLQEWTANASQMCLQIVGVETEVSGNTLVINGHQVEIIEACNGMRMVFPLILLTYAFCFGLPLRNGVRFMLLLASPLVALACNVVRTVPTIWLYGYRKDLADTFHDYSSWAMLFIGFVLLLGLIKVLRWAMLPITRYPLASQYA